MDGLGWEVQVMGTDIQKRRVLLVEDEFLICDMLVEALAEHGFEVKAVANATEALRHLTCGSPCDILLTDINLPGSIDGTALARLARELRPKLPVVYASGSYNKLDDLDAVAGALFVPKPYNPDQICDMLNQVTGTAH
jgi:CheY-like chemotaxis protein